MKKFILCASISLVLSASALAQNHIISYQGVIQGMNGAAVTDSIYPITISLWTDSSGGTALWRDVFETLVKNGVFNIALGSGAPLPSPSAMDRPLWLGVNFNGAENNARYQLGTVPMALNVANSAITTAKIADGAITPNKLNLDYVSVVTIDGRPVTTQGDTLRIISGGGIQFHFDSVTKELSADIPPQPIVIHTGGDGIDNPCAPSNSDGDNGTNTVAGGCSNIMDSATDHDFIAGGESNTIDSADHSSIGGGEKNLITPGGRLPGTDADPVSYSTISGGYNNTAYDPYSFIGGGQDNVAGEENSLVVGGAQDTALAAQSVVVGGLENRVGITHVDDGGADGSFIGSGDNNKVDGSESAIITGSSNIIASGAGGSIIGSGIENYIQAAEGVISGGESDTILKGSVETYYHSTIGGGRNNRISSSLAVIAGGLSNRIDTQAHYSSIGGGQSNQIRDFATNAVIAGGNTNTIDAAATYSAIGGGRLNFIGSPFSFIAGGDTNKIDSSSDHTFLGGGLKNSILSRWPGDPIGAEYSVLVGGRGNNIFDSLDVLAGGDSNTVLAPWAFLGGGAHNFAGDSGVFGLEDSFAVAVGGRDNWSREEYSAIVGGQGNQTMGAYGFIGGGEFNLIDEEDSLFTHYSAISGGFHNWIRSSYSILTGGDSNLIENGSNYGFIGGGHRNIIKEGADTSAIVGGDSNIVQGPLSFIGGGCHNQVFPAKWGTIGGGCGNAITDTLTFIGGGQDNFIAADLGVIGGGELNQIQVLAGNTTKPSVGTIGGGLDNTIAALNPVYLNPLPSGYTLPLGGTIAGGVEDTVSGHFASVIGGIFGRAIGKYSAVVGGRGLLAQDYQTVVGRYNDTTTLGGGLNNLGVGSTGTSPAPIGWTGTNFLIPETLLNPDAPTFIVGNGGVTSSTGGGLPVIEHRSNAFTVSDDGHSTVFDNDASGGTTNGYTNRKAVYGARYVDNSIYGWAVCSFSAGPPPMITVTSSFGVILGGITRLAAGHYHVQLNTVDPDNLSTSHLPTTGAVTATIQSGSTDCNTITATALTAGGFDILIHEPSTCTLIDDNFMFIVVGR